MYVQEEPVEVRELSDPLELELQIRMSLHVVSGNQTQVLCNFSSSRIMFSKWQVAYYRVMKLVWLLKKALKKISQYIANGKTVDFGTVFIIIIT